MSPVRQRARRQAGVGAERARQVEANSRQRPPGHPHGSCGTSGAAPLWDHLGRQLQAKNLADVGMAATGCLGFCGAGPLMVVYPAGVWYQPRSAADIDEIVQTHLVGDGIVERLAVILKP